MKVPASRAAQALINTIQEFGDVDVQINFIDLAADTLAAITLPTNKSQTSMPFTPNIYAPHGAIFSKN